MSFSLHQESSSRANGCLSAFHAVRKCAPELGSLAACLLLAFALRLCGDTSGNQDAGWEEIKAEWPLLMGADTLLALQAMLRLIVLGSVTVRTQLTRGSMPLGGEAAALWLGAGICRAIVVTLCIDYKLDGPLGGNTPVFCELLTLFLVSVLGADALRQRPAIFAAIAAGVAWFACGHRMNLSQDDVANGLFIAAHCFDLMAAFAYLCRTMLTDVGFGPCGEQVYTMGFAHVILTVQQCLAAYFFMVAFDDWGADYINAGLPFQLLAGSNLLQFAFYAVSTTLFFGEMSVEQPSGGARMPY